MAAPYTLLCRVRPFLAKRPFFFWLLKSTFVQGSLAVIPLLFFGFGRIITIIKATTTHK